MALKLDITNDYVMPVGRVRNASAKDRISLDDACEKVGIERDEYSSKYNFLSRLVAGKVKRPSGMTDDSFQRAIGQATAALSIDVPRIGAGRTARDMEVDEVDPDDLDFNL